MLVDPRLAGGDHVNLGQVARKGAREEQRREILGRVEGEGLPDADKRVEVLAHVGSVSGRSRASLCPEARNHRPAGVIGNRGIGQDLVPHVCLDPLPGARRACGGRVLTTGHRVVTGLECGNVLLGGGAAAHERDEQAPLEVNVQVETVQRLGAVVECPDGIELLAAGCVARGSGDEHALGVRARSCGAGQEKQATAGVLRGLLAALRGDEGTHRLVNVAQSQRQQAHVVLDGDRGQRQVEVVAGLHLAVAGHVPGGGHDDPARE